jgi:hypothetical protein
MKMITEKFLLITHRGFIQLKNIVCSPNFYVCTCVNLASHVLFEFAMENNKRIFLLLDLLLNLIFFFQVTFSTFQQHHIAAVSVCHFFSLLPSFYYCSCCTLMHDTLKNISEIKIKRTIIIKATISA